MSPSDESDRCGNGVAQRAEPRLTQALEEYRGLLEAGAAPDRSAFVARHPDLAEALAECLSGLEFVHAVAPAVSGAAAETAAAADAGAGVGPGAPLGDFRILREVGRGGMGVVYEAEQLSLGRRVALKVLPFASTLDPRQLQRFHNEARAAAGLHHTNIVPVYGVGSERGVHYYAMQFIDGRTLADVIAQLRGGPPAPGPTVDEAPAATTAPPAVQATSAAPRDVAYFRRVAGWGIQAAEALDCAHALGVVHRDVKPANLLVDAAGRLWVTDFGLAQVQSDARLTMTGDLVGTLRYMSPEQALAKRAVMDHRTDVYSLGATLYELLTLEPAFPGSDRQKLLRQIAFEEPELPRRLSKAIPAELETIVLKALEKNPAERYATAHELADDLRRFQEDRPLRARRASVLQRLRKWARRHQAAVAAAAVCLLVTLVALGGSVGWVLNDRMARQREAESKVLEALATAGPRLPEGNPGNPALLAAAQRVEAQLGNGAVGPEVRRRAEQLLRDVRMLIDLDEARLNRAETKDGAMFNIAGAEARHAAAFRSYGVDVLALEPDEAASRIRASAIREALLAGLDSWMELNGLDGRMVAKLGDIPARARLGRVANAADDNAWRRSFREALLASDRQKLKALAEQPQALAQSPAVLAWLGSVLHDNDLLTEARAVLRRAQRQYPADFWINYQLGSTFINCPRRQQHPDEAVGYCRAAVALRPGSAEALCLLGCALSGKGDLDAGILAIRQAHARDPQFMSARYQWCGNLANLRASDPRLKEVEAEAREAIRHKPDDPAPHFDLGYVLLLQRRYNEAEVEHRVSIRLNPDDSMAHDHLGSILQGQGRYEEAEAEHREAIRLEPDDPWPHGALASVLRRLGRQKEADKEAEEEGRCYIRRDPDNTMAHGQLADILSAQARYKEAAAEYREAIGLGPGDAAVRNNLAWFLATCPDLEMRDPGQALTHARRAVELRPGNGVLWNTLGVAQYRKGDWKAAIEALMKSTQLRNRGDSFDFFFLAMAHWKLNDKEEARAWYDQAVAWMERNNPQNEELKRFRAEATALLGPAKAAGPQKKQE